ncbi:MAG TPA: hypothetical protein VFK85_13015, partial [Anaeromyxobacteraceae bacterium]|nr:hypothetical protein [Anaeromyxobacteraceae bacterium]
MRLEPSSLDAVVRIGLSQPSGGGKERDEPRLAGIVVRIEPRSTLGVWHRSVRIIIAEPVDDAVEQLALDAAETLALGNAPALELRGIL